MADVAQMKMASLGQQVCHHMSRFRLSRQVILMLNYRYAVLLVSNFVAVDRNLCHSLRIRMGHNFGIHGQMRWCMPVTLNQAQMSISGPYRPEPERACRSLSRCVRKLVVTRPGQPGVSTQGCIDGHSSCMFEGSDNVPRLTRLSVRIVNRI